ncbi:TonB-dependent receptor [Haliscomenobacter sp.]|uniref:TonB-dependent receptor n=1 Tax=Haliscomenobacter sp. TaxID=2717303 RepID=UPI0033651325
MKYIILLFLSIPIFVTAQKGSIQGFIFDESNRNPLIGVSVSLGDNVRGAVSDDAGNFALGNLSAGSHQLTFSYLGYQSHQETVEVSDKGTVRVQISLKSGEFTLKEAVIKGQSAHQQQTINQIDIRLRPIINSQEILRMVPGLFMGQHAGGGKAEQIFLRGFDIDHGTDIRLTVDGLPVNMVSHAHGQGYADLHFVIPELVEKVNFEKGPYYADKGNFSTAGWVDFRTKEVLDRSFTKFEIGQYGTARGVAAINLLGETARQKGQSAYLASEYSYTESYFDAPQHFNRVNVQGRYNGVLSPSTRMSLTGSHFWSKWNHSGQIPDRAVESGLISFYGSVDPSEGGETSRSNANLQLVTQMGKGASWKNQFFYSHYQFELYSNFTFFLEDPVNGDQIRQKEDRSILGYNGSLNFPSRFGSTTIGVQYRQDMVNDVELSNTRNRTITEQNIQLGDVQEGNLGLYLDDNLQLGRKATLNLGLRYDFFQNRYTDHLQDDTRASASSGIFSPKINLNYNASEKIRLYLNTGRSFHSNDTRVVVPQNGRKILPAAYGTDLGVVWKPIPNLFVNTGLWYLWLEQEFVYVGDAGVIEPSGRTRRWGYDLSARYQLSRRLFVDVDANWAQPRAIGEAKGENYLPLAPLFTSVGGLSLVGDKGFSGSLRYRYMANRPANEDNSIAAKGYFVPDVQLNYAYKKKWELGLNLQNVINTQWKETQFATESRLFNETEPVEEIHFTPGTPFFARLSFTLFF